MRSATPCQMLLQLWLAQHRQNGRSGLAAGEDLVDRALEDAPSAEPVVVVAEAFDAVFAGKLGLRVAGLRQAQVM